MSAELPLPDAEPLNADGWIATSQRVPCFVCFGFQTGKKIRFRLDDGSEHEDIYQGWGIFGTGVGVARDRVTHWKPIDAAPTDNNVHAHDGAHAEKRIPSAATESEST